MPETMRETADNTPYAGFWVRLLAAIIDMLLYVPFYVALKYGFSRLMPHPIGPMNGDVDYLNTQIVPANAAQWWFEGLFDIASLVIYAAFFASRMQGSPGMYLLKFHISDRQGNRISFLRAFMWCLTAVAGWLVCCAGILYMQKDITIVTEMKNSCQEQNVDFNECIPEIEKAIGIPFPDFQTIVLSSAGLTIFLYIVWALSIALPKDKTGFHNLLCGTRLLKGRRPA